MLLDMSTPGGATLALLPELLLTAWALVVLMVVAWRHKTAHDMRVVGTLSLVGYALAGLGTAWLAWQQARPDGLSMMIALDGFRYASDGLLVAIGAAITIMSLRWLERQGILAPEYYVLLMLATVGMMLLAGAVDMTTLFLGLGRSRAEILPDRLLRVGLPALRHRAGLRRHRPVQFHAHRRAAREHAADADGQAGDGAGAGGLCLQGGRGAVPRLGTRRL